LALSACICKHFAFPKICESFLRKVFLSLSPLETTFAPIINNANLKFPLKEIALETLNIPVFGVVSEEAERLGIPTWVIGGFVRDRLLKQESKDADFVCTGDCLELASAVAERLDAQKSLTVFKNFGTAQVKSDGWILEFVSARKESYRNDSRKPEVEPGTLEEDQLRRDLSINALAISISGKDKGSWLDPFHGLEDLQNKIIRTPQSPETTFSDDPLRMLRCIRFAARLNFDIEPETFEGIRNMKSRLSIISAERISDELNKIIQINPPSYGFKLLYYSGLLEEFFPELVALAGVENRDGKAHKDNFFHTLEVLDNVAAKSSDLWLRWAAILHDIAKPATKRFVPGEGWTFHGHEERGARMVPKIFNRLKLPLNEHMRFVEKLVRLHLRPISLTNVSVTDSAVRRLMFEAGNDLEALMQLCRADVTTKNPNKARRYLEKFDQVEQKMALVEEADRLRSFQPLLTGELIMEVFGIKPGKEVGTLKEQIREAILEGQIKNTLQECLFLAIQLGDNLGLKPADNFDGQSFLDRFPE
jgi:putative nucleotidyltransferase with HDIG domain